MQKSANTYEAMLALVISNIEEKKVYEKNLKIQFRYKRTQRVQTVKSMDTRQPGYGTKLVIMLNYSKPN